MRNLFMIAAAAAAITACATTPNASAEERASCERMAAAMGTDTTHDHREMKGQGSSSMNTSHQRCQRILRQAQ